MKALLSLLFVGWTAALSAQIIGTVTDENNRPLDFATISIYTPDSTLIDGVSTDATGQFSLDAKPGAYYLLAEFISYRSLYRDGITLERGKPFDVGTLQLLPNTELLDEFVVEAERSSMEIKLDKRVFNVGKDLSARGSSAIDLLDNVPSVQVDVEGNVSLRGNGGVRILINGRPSGLVGDGGQGLRALQADLIERVEVITNPSARYEAEGSVGIINIVLKKDRRKGLNGSFDVTGGLPLTYGAAANLNYRSGNFNWFTNYGVMYRSSIGSSSLSQEIYRNRDNELPDTTFLSEQDGDRDRGGINHNFRLGADYFFNDQTTLTFAGRLNFGNDDNLNATTYRDFFRTEGATDAVFLGSEIRTDNELEDEEEIEFSLVFRKEFDQKDRLWTADVRYQDETEDESSRFLNTFFNPDGSPAALPDEVQRSQNIERNKNLILQTDYTHPVGEEGLAEGGIRVGLREITNDFLVEQQIGGEFQTVNGLSSDFLYDENIYAAYLMYGNKWGDFSYQFGIRPEYTDVLTLVQNTDDPSLPEARNPRDYLNVFPSANFGYEFSERSSVQLSFSRRVRRPRFWDLNPFFTFSDNRNFFSGNPDLDPEFSSNFEAGYLHILGKGSLYGAVYYRNTTGVIERVRLVDSNGDSNTRPENLGNSDNLGLEFNGNYRLAKWWRFNADFNFFREEITQTVAFDRLPLGTLDAETFTWFTRGTTQFDLGKSTEAQLRFNYRAPRVTPQGKRFAIASIDLAASHDVLKGNGTLTLSVRDLFNSRRRRYETFGENFRNEGDFQWRGTTGTLTLNYRLNQQKQRRRGGGGGYDGGGDGEF